MVQRRQRERSLFEVLLPDGHKLWPDWLRKIDILLEDEAVIEVVAQGLEARWPQSRCRGRPGTSADVVIRMSRRNECALSDGQLSVAGRRARADRMMRRASSALGDPRGRIQDRRRS